MRKYADAGLDGTMSCTGALRSRRSTTEAPPDDASSPRVGPAIDASTSRNERTGPTVPTAAALRDWNIAAKRVMPPSTSSSTTRSARSSPVCGRAALLFSILTTRAGWAATFSTRAPVSGATTGRAADGVTELDGLAGVVGLAVVDRGAAGWLLHAPAARPTTTAATTPVTKRLRGALTQRPYVAVIPPTPRR